MVKQWLNSVFQACALLFSAGVINCLKSNIVKSLRYMTTNKKSYHSTYGLLLLAPLNLPELCDGCGNNFTIDHAMNCVVLDLQKLSAVRIHTDRMQATVSRGVLTPAS